MKKRILFVFFTLKGGGAEKVVIQIANNIVQNSQYEINFFVYDNSTFYKSIIDKRIKIIQMNYKIDFERKLNFYFNGYWKFGQSLSKINFQEYDHIIAVHEQVPEFALIRVYFKKLLLYPKLREKLVLWLHGNHIKIKESNLGRVSLHFLIKKLRKLIFTKFISNSYNIKKDFNYLRNISIVYNPIDIKYITKTSLLQPKNRNKATKREYYLLAAKISWDKNQLLLLKAFKLIKNQINENIILIGLIQDSVLYNELNKFILDNSLEDRVFILGMSSNPYYYFKNSNALICTSLYESFSMAVHEAMALKKITVVTKYPGYEEFFNNNNSIIVDPDEVQLSKVLLNLSKGNINTEEIINNAYLYVQKYNINKCTEEFLKIFD